MNNLIIVWIFFVPDEQIHMIQISKDRFLTIYYIENSRLTDVSRS